MMFPISCTTRLKRISVLSCLRLSCCVATLLTAQMLVVQLYFNNESSSFELLLSSPDNTIMIQSELAIDPKESGRHLDQLKRRDDLDIQNASQHATNNNNTVIEVTSNPFAHNNNHNDLAVFYNIYVNKEKINLSIPHDIVLEQLQQIGQSHAAASGNLTIYYNTVGHAILLDANFSNQIQARCDQVDLQCVHMEHHQAGFEEITLQKAYEYCNRFPAHKIIYLHNKGSHNAGRWNIPWRRHMTRAITDELCLNNTDPCTTCGLLFQPVWTFFFPGNFFVSGCDYINRLIPPVQFEKKINEMLQQRPTEMMGLLFDEWESTHGRQRYSMEHWIGSHPSFVPCHLSTDPNIRTWTADEGLPFVLMNASQLPLHSQWFQSKQIRMRQILNDEPSRKREWFLLGGLLFKWYTLYHEYPTESSWIWNYFPDGREWHDLVSRYSDDVSLALNEAWQKAPASELWANMVKKEMDRRELNRLLMIEKEKQLKRRNAH